MRAFHREVSDGVSRLSRTRRAEARRLKET